MNVLPLRRPVGGLKALFRQTRHQRHLQTMSAARPKPTQVIAQSSIADLYTHHKNRLTFAVHPAVPSIRTTNPDPMPAYHRTELARLDPTGARAALFSRSRPDAAHPGDIVLVTPRHAEPFAGVMLQIRRRGVDTAIQLRGQAMGTGVEMWYKVYSPEVIGIDIVWRRRKRARRARLTYMRKPEHDMGSVEKQVLAWKKEQFALRNKGKKKMEYGVIGTRF